MSERQPKYKTIKTLPGFSITLEPATILGLNRMSTDLAMRTRAIALEPALRSKTESPRQIPFIEIDRIPLSDRYAVGLLSRERGSDDYRDGFTFFPPATVNRRLFSPVCIERWQTTAREVEEQGVRDLDFINVRHNFFNASSHEFGSNVFSSESDPLSLPLEMGVSYTYDLHGEKIRVAGSPIVSVLHGLSRSPDQLSKELQQSMIEEYFGDYLKFLPDHDVTVLAIPPRKEGSPTHNAFAKYAIAHPVTSDIVEHTTFGEKSVGLYFFAHGEGEVLERNKQRARELMTDSRYRGALEVIDETWNTNFRSIITQKAPNETEEYGVAMSRIIAEDHEQAICRFLAENFSSRRGAF